MVLSPGIMVMLEEVLKMNKLPFVLWMLGWPLITEISNYLMYLKGHVYSSEAELITAILEYAVWIIIGIISYERK